MKKNSKLLLTSIMSTIMLLGNFQLASASTINNIEQPLKTEVVEQEIQYGPSAVQAMPRKSFGMSITALTSSDTASVPFYTSDGPNIAVSVDALFTCNANQNYVVTMYVVDANSNSYSPYITPKLVFTNNSNEDQRSKIFYLGKNRNYRFIVDVDGTNLPYSIPLSVGIYNYG